MAKTERPRLTKEASAASLEKTSLIDRKSPAKKVLRIGIILNKQALRIDDERLIRRGEGVTIGRSAQNTFAFPASKLPETFTLFQAAGREGPYAVRFSEKMDGKISLKGNEHTLAELKRSPRTTSKEGIYETTLDESAKGKVQVGDITFLFQFVPEPAAVPRPPLPKEAQGDFFSKLDRVFATIFLVSFLVHSIVASVAWYRVVPDEPEFDEENPLIVAIKQPPIVIPPPQEVAVAEVGTEESDEAVAEKPAEKPKSGGGGAAKAGTAGNPKGTAGGVRDKGALGAIGRLRGSGGALANILDSDSGTGGDLDAAFSGVGGVAVATAGTDIGGGLRPGDGGGGDGTGGLEGLNAGDVGAKGVTTDAASSGTKGPERKVTASVKTGVADIEEGGGGTLDSAAISSALNRRASGFQACYERELLKNENLQGKITIRLVISEAGSLISATASLDTVGSSDLTSCVLGKVPRKFPENPGGGTTTAEYGPIIFARQN